MSARALQRALALLETWPPDAIARLVEKLIETMDTAEPDADAEAEPDDGCEAEDVLSSCLHGIGDLEDAEEDGCDERDDEAEQDADDLGQAAAASSLATIVCGWVRL